MSAAPDPNPDLDIQLRDGGVAFSVRVVPGASRTTVTGVWERSLRVAVAAPPEGGRANDELVAFLARSLGVRRRQVAVVRGATHRTKVILVSTSAVTTLAQRIRTLAGQS